MQLSAKELVVNELHKPARKTFTRRRTIIKGFDDLWQADLAEVTNYAKENNGYKYILVVIDCFSKFVWCRPIKNKSANDVEKAMDYILKISKRIPKNLQTDQGTEFYNTQFQSLMKKYYINHYSTFSVKKAAIVERVIRTLKEKLYRLFSLNGNYKWLSILEDVTDKYNNTKHSSINMRPKDVSKNNELEILQKSFNHIKIALKPKFQVGDFVRISKSKHVFAKGYTPNWTTELFKIKKIKITNPTTYLLEDYHGRPISGGFYEKELQKTLQSDIYLVEKIIRKKGQKLFVKWLGFDNTHNSWINKNDIQ